MSLFNTLIRSFSRNWVHRPPRPEKGSYFDRPLSKGSFKLLELNERYNFILPGNRVLDLGSSPGGWSEVAAQACNASKENVLVYSVDMETHPIVDGSVLIVADVTAEESQNLLLKSVRMPVDVVLSDLSQRTSDDRDVDCEMQWSYTLDALRICNILLKQGGVALLKMYLGLEEPKHFETVKEFFQSVERVKTTSGSSREIFYLSKGWKLNSPKETVITKENIKTLTEQLLASGGSLDADLEAKIRKEIGDFEKDNPKYKYLKDEEESFDHYTKTVGNTSFNNEVPEGIADLERIVKKMQEENVQPENFIRDEFEEENYQEYASNEIRELIRSLNLNEDFYSEEMAKEDFEDGKKNQFLKDFSSENMEEAFTEVRENVLKETKRAKNNPGKEFEDWQNAGKDSEFWHN